MVEGTIPLTVLVRRGGCQEDALLLVLYISVAAGFVAWLTLPYIDWSPTTETLFAVSAWSLD